MSMMLKRRHAQECGKLQWDRFEKKTKLTGGGTLLPELRHQDVAVSHVRKWQSWSWRNIHVGSMRLLRQTKPYAQLPTLLRGYLDSQKSFAVKSSTAFLPSGQCRLLLYKESDAKIAGWQSGQWALFTIWLRATIQSDRVGGDSILWCNGKPIGLSSSST